MCVTGNSDNNLPWEQALQWEADFTTQSSQLTIKIDAWEKDANGAICTWAHGDEPSQRVQDEFTFPAMSTGQTQTWSRTMTFQNRDSMPWDGYCSTTIEGRVTKIASSTVSVTPPLARVSFFAPPLHFLLFSRAVALAVSCHAMSGSGVDSGWVCLLPPPHRVCVCVCVCVGLWCLWAAAAAGVQEAAPRIMGTQVTLVNNVPKLRITGRDLHPDPQELPVVQITGGGGDGGGSTACIANSIQASGTTTNNQKLTNTLSLSLSLSL
jgi:hypothetical protein